jgi:hypothetical protein
MNERSPTIPRAPIIASDNDEPRHDFTGYQFNAETRAALAREVAMIE